LNGCCLLQRFKEELNRVEIFYAKMKNKMENHNKPKANYIDAPVSFRICR
jgi:hypothetical protein